MQRTLEPTTAHIDQVLALVLAELDAAQVRFAPFHSAHEGYAVLLEEVDELWEEIRTRHPDPRRMCAEAMQVAAMGIRFMLEAGPGDMTRLQARDLVRMELSLDITIRPYSSPLKDCAGLTEHLGRLWRAVRENRLAQAAVHAVPVAALAARMMLPAGGDDGPTT